jgi:hypothetical protein
MFMTVLTMVLAIAVTAGTLAFCAMMLLLKWMQRRQQTVALQPPETPQPMELRLDLDKALARMNRRLYWVVPMLVALTVLEGVFLGWRFACGLAAFLAVEFFLLGYTVRRRLRQQSGPAVTLGPEGISVNLLATRIGQLQWHEIADVRCYWLLYRFVGIVPVDSATVYQRIGMKRSFLMRMNQFLIPMYRLFGTFVAPINIPDEYLPLSADELAAQIQGWRQAQTLVPEEVGR